MPRETLAHVWHDRVRRTPDALAFEYRQRGLWRTMNWRQADDRVRRISFGLRRMGVKPGDRVAILCGTRVEWILVDLAILCAGAVTTTIYPSSTADECRWILEDSGATVCVAEDHGQIGKLRSLDVPDLRIVGIDGPGSEDLPTLSAIEVDGSPADFRAIADELRGDDLATLIYTSGTTGRPKGVMLTNGGWLYEADAIELQTRALRRPDDKQYLFLPLAHAYGKVLELVAVHLGMPTAVEGDIEGLLAGLQHTRPTFMGAVPRVFEKVHAKIAQTAQQKGEMPHRIFRWAEEAGEAYTEAALDGRRPGLRATARYRVARRLVHRRVRQAFGGRIRAFISGGAPLSPELARFFYAAGIRILEGYGLTETTAGAVGNRYDDFRFGTVGRPFPGTEVSIADDGEVRIRGRNVMRGYWNDPTATAAVIDGDGWFHTGDLGSFDHDGYLRITGRKKDILITAAGKNIAPQPIENRLKVSSPWISEVVMLGDRRPYCVALICIDEEAVARWAEDQGLSARGYADLSVHPAVLDLIEREVGRVNSELPSYATIKRVALLDHELSEERGELTPSLKVKRAVVAERFAAIVDGLYERGRVGRSVGARG